MRIAHIIFGRCNPDSANGVDKTVYYLAKNQAELGVAVAIFSFTNKAPIPIPSVEVIPLQVVRWGAIGAKLPFVHHDAVAALLDWNPNIVHLHSVHIGPFLGIGRMMRRNSIPYVVTPHGGYAPGRLAQTGLAVRAYIRFLEKPYLESAKFVHAVSQNDIEGLSLLGIRTRSVLVPNGIGTETLPTQLDTNLLRQRFPALEGKRIFLFLGRLDPVHKGLDMLLAAFAASKLKGAALVLVGPDWRGSLPRLQSLTSQLGLMDQVVFTGPIYGQEKWNYLAGADVFLHPSRWEGASFSVLEAMAIGKPVLVSRAADPGQNGAAGAGLTVEPDEGSLAEGLRHMAITGQMELEQMGRNARRLVEEHFNWRTIANDTIGAYARCCSGCSDPGDDRLG